MICVWRGAAVELQSTISVLDHRAGRVRAGVVLAIVALLLCGELSLRPIPARAEDTKETHSDGQEGKSSAQSEEGSSESSSAAAAGEEKKEAAIPKKKKRSAKGVSLPPPGGDPR